jgi:hypothetical protein
MALYFQRDATLRVFPNKADGTYPAGSTAYDIPLLEGFSFSQTTNSSEVTLSEMESTTGNSRRGRKMFNDSLAPVEWSFSTYLRPYLASTSANPGSGTTFSWADGDQHLVDEVLWNALLAKGRIGEANNEVDKITITTAGSGYTTPPAITFSGGGGSSATATSSIGPSGDVTDINITAGGTGFTSAPTVVVGTIFAASTALALGAQVFHGVNLYTVTTAGTTHGSTVPTHTSGAVANGSATLTFAGLKAVATATFGDTDDAVASRGGSQGAATSLPLVMDSAKSNKAALNTMSLEFNFGNNLVYRLNKAVCNSATINFDVEGIATVEWSGMAATITPLTTHTVANVTDTAGGNAGSAINEGGTSADTENFIRNRLTSMSIVPKANGTTIGANTATNTPFNSSGYNLTLTGGSITIENNISYLTPEELGVVNKPIEHVTGVRNVGGSFTCYLASGNGNSKEFFEDLTTAAGLDVITHDFTVVFKVGGASATPRVEFEMPQCHVEVPSHSVDDVIALETTFTSLQSDMEDQVADDFTLKSFGVALS